MSLREREERLAAKISAAEMIPYSEALIRARKVIQDRQPEVIRTNAYAKWRSEGSGAGKKSRYNSKSRRKKKR